MRKKLRLLSGLVLISAALANCSKNGLDAGNFTPLPLDITAPADNPQTPEKIALGRMLFWDPVLSGRKDVACASCHHPSLGYADARDLPVGVNGQGLGATRNFVLPNVIPFAKRNSLSIVNTAFNGIGADDICNPATAAMFFDNRTRSLELQCLEPIKALEEMKGMAIAPTDILDSVVARLKNISQYVQLFNDAFQTGSAVTIQNIGKAMAAYERTIVANHSPYDEYMRGNRSAMSATQVQGMNAFVSNGCIKCHSGPMFSDYSLHVLSVPDNPKLPSDAGANGSYAFRTPSLRNLPLTAPYMHSGVFASLDAVLDFYDRIGEHNSQNPHVAGSQLDGNLQRINNRDKAVIIQFLTALSDGSFDKSIPTSVPSGLHPGGNIP